MKATWILTGVLILGVLAVPTVLRFVYSEVRETSAGTLDYWIGIPDDVKSIPVIRACNKPIYGSLARSGSTPAFARVTYQTEASLTHATAVMQGHFEADGCTPRADGGLLCESGRVVTISVADGAPCNVVTVNVHESAGR